MSYFVLFPCRRQIYKTLGSYCTIIFSRLRQLVSRYDNQLKSNCVMNYIFSINFGQKIVIWWALKDQALSLENWVFLLHKKFQFSKPFSNSQAQAWVKWALLKKAGPWLLPITTKKSCLYNFVIFCACLRQLCQTKPHLDPWI